MKSWTFLLGMVLAACLFAGCSKHASQEAAAPKIVPLGTVELSPGQPSRQDLGDGAVCVITATPLGADSLELIASLEKSGKQVTATRIAPATADRPLDISLGAFRIGLTPHMK